MTEPSGSVLSIGGDSQGCPLRGQSPIPDHGVYNAAQKVIVSGHDKMKPSSTCSKHLQPMIPSKARMAYLCSRLFYQLVPARGRSIINARLGSRRPFFCPVCEDPVSGFAPLPHFYSQQLKQHGSDLRLENCETCNFKAYQCAHCGASDRDRFYALFLAGRLPSNDAQQTAFSLLDIAPSGPLSRHITRKYGIHYRTADLFLKNVDDRVDITAMTCYANDSFDAFICSHVLEHVPDDRKALGELWRILKPGGWGIAMVPIDISLPEIREDPACDNPALRWKHFGQGDHVRLYSRQGFIQRLQQAGFRVNELGQEQFRAEAMTRCGVAPSSILYVVEKSLPIP